MRTHTIFIPYFHFFLLAVFLIYGVPSFTQTPVAGTSKTSYQLIVPELVAQGESFSGSIMGKNEQGYFPLSAGSAVSIQGQIVRTGQGGKIKLPPVTAGECGQNSNIEILFDGNCKPNMTSAFFPAPSIAVVPGASSSYTIIRSTPDLIQAGAQMSVHGKGMNRLKESGLRNARGEWFPLQSVASSSLQQKYLTPTDLPAGRYRFEGTDAEGVAIQAAEESICSNLKMSGPALRKIKQKGRILLESNTDGVLTVWGGLPQIELRTAKDMQTSVQSEGGALILIEAQAGRQIALPFIARQIGQYTVFAELLSPEEAANKYKSPPQCDLRALTTQYDPQSKTTEVKTLINVQDETGRPLPGKSVETIISHPEGITYADAISDAAGMATVETKLQGAWPEGSINVAAYRPAFGKWRQEPFFSAQSAAVFFNLNEQVPVGNNIAPLTENAEDDEKMAEIYRANKRRWGNYQGICGTALMEMCRYYPKLCEEFKQREQEIEEWLNGLKNVKPEGEQAAEDQNNEQLLDPAMADIYRKNKRRWGNYQGICGTALFEICQNYPKLCEEFKQAEKAIEEWLETLDEHSSTPEDSSSADANRQNQNHQIGNPPSKSPQPNPQPDRPIESQEENEAEDNNPIPEEDRAELEDGVVKRAFESNDVAALRILEVKLGHVGAAITQIGGKYFITYKKKVVFDPETGRPVNYWEFNEAKELNEEDWYVVYLLSLGSSPLNMIARIVESAESLGKSFLDDLFQDMKTKGHSSRLMEVAAEHLMLLCITVSFEQSAMPQLGDHVREADDHLQKALAAAERGDWTTALEEWEAAKTSMAWLALEIIPGMGGAAGKTAGRTARGTAKPLIEVAEGATRQLDEVAEVLRKAAKNETNQDLARHINRQADKVEEMAEQANRIRRTSNLGRPRPANYPVAAKDRAALENHFGKSNVKQVGRRDPKNMLEVVDADGNKQVWVRPEYTDYRKAYESVRGPIPDGFDADHLQSRARGAQQGYGYVRLELVDSDVNQAWGRHMETRTVNAGRQGHVEPNGPAPIRNIDNFQWWKLQGISPERVEQWFQALIK